MKIAIVGGGASGVYLSILLKKKYPDYDVLLIEKNEKILKKMYATGNGKCNIANKNLDTSVFNHPLFIEPLLNKYNFGKQEEFFQSIGIVLKENNDLIYPQSKSAKNVVHQLENVLKKIGVKIYLNSHIKDYKINPTNICIALNDKDILCDKIIFATGGKSTPILGSDGSVFSILNKHGYDITSLLPGLSPIKVKENVKKLDGIRNDTFVTLTNKDRIIHRERGEVLFKKDGLSGIVMFNTSSFIAHLKEIKDVKIYLDLLPDKSLLELANEIISLSSLSFGHILDAYFPNELSEYIHAVSLIEKRVGLYTKKEAYLLAKTIKNLVFSFKDFYGFANSQITVGGVSLDNINDDFSSKIEKNVFFIGEVIDIDGLCGGYNLMWALISAMNVVDNIKN